MIKFESVSKKYPNGQSALSDINLSIKSAEFVFIVGPSGAGKTTLLKLLTKEVTPTSGKIFLNNEEIIRIPTNKTPYLRRKIGTVFQDFKLLLTRTVFENVALPLEVLSYKDAEIEKSVSSILEKVNLLDKANRFPAQLSGGEVQRTAIARAIVSKPEVLLVDEPTADLDPKTARSIVEILDKINKLDKTTVIMATHNVQIVNYFKKRVVTLTGGQVTSDEKEGQYERD